MVNRIRQNLAILTVIVLGIGPVFSNGIIRRIEESSHDDVGNTVKFSVLGDSIVGERSPEVSLNFIYSIDPHDVTTTVSGTGAMTQTSGMAKLSTGASASSSSSLESKASLLYHPGYQAEAEVTALFPTCTVGNNSLIGLGVADGAIQIGCVGTSFVIRHDDGFGTVTDTAQASWNRDRAISADNEHGFILDPTKMNIYRIAYAWGSLPITVEIYMGRRKGWRPVHTVDAPNTRTTPHLKNPSMPMIAFTSNTTNTTNLDLYTSSWSAWHVGPVQDAGYRTDALAAAAVLVGGTESHMASIRVSNVFQSVTNRIPVMVRALDAAVDGTKTVAVRAYHNCATLTGGGWVAVNTDSSVAEYNTGVSSFTCATSTLVKIMQMGKTGSKNVEFLLHGVRVLPGETITITASSGAASNVSMAVHWIELF